MTEPDATHPSQIGNRLEAFSDLTPDLILDALDDVGVRGDGRMLALNSYENRVYLIYVEDGDDVVVKFYRPARWTDEQINEEHEFAAELVAAEIPAVAPIMSNGRTLHKSHGYRLALYPRAGGRAPELDDPNVLEWLGRFLGRIHAVGAVRRFATRPSVDTQSYAIEPREFLLSSGFIPPELVEPWRVAVDQCIDAVVQAFDRAGDVASIRVHGDCHMGNVLWTEDGPHFVDLDDARHGPAMQDLWMLLSGDRANMTRQFCDVLAGYEDFAEFDRRELALLEPLRTLRLIHYSAWIARRWHDPAFPVAFPFFESHRYWQDRILELREQIGAMAEEPLVV